MLMFSNRTGKMALYHKRHGGETTKRANGKTIISTIRGKWYGLQEVPQYHDSLALVRAYHNNSHEGHNTTEFRLGQKFFFPLMADKIAAVSGQNCSICAIHEPIKKSRNPRRPFSPAGVGKSLCSI